MEEEGEKERKKEKPGVILASKRKRQKVKSGLGVFLSGGGVALSGTEGCVNICLCVHTGTPNQRDYC